MADEHVDIVKVYYKTTENEQGEEVHHSLDELFLPKLNLAENVPESEETGIQDTKRDLSNYYEKFSQGWTINTGSATGEPSNIFIGADKGSPVNYGKVIGAPGTGTTIATVSHPWQYVVNQAHVVEIPYQYRNRLMYWNQWQQFHFNAGQTEFSTAGGGFIAPGTTHITVYITGMVFWEHYRAHIQLHEVEPAEIYSNDIVNKYGVYDKRQNIPWYIMNATTTTRGSLLWSYRPGTRPVAPWYECYYDIYGTGMSPSGKFYGAVFYNNHKPAGDNFFKMNVNWAVDSGVGTVANIRAVQHPSPSFIKTKE